MQQNPFAPQLSPVLNSNHSSQEPYNPFAQQFPSSTKTQKQSIDPFNFQSSSTSYSAAGATGSSSSSSYLSPQVPASTSLPSSSSSATSFAYPTTTNSSNFQSNGYASSASDPFNLNIFAATPQTQQSAPSSVPPPLAPRPVNQIPSTIQPNGMSSYSPFTAASTASPQLKPSTNIFSSAADTSSVYQPPPSNYQFNSNPFLTTTTASTSTAASNLSPAFGATQLYPSSATGTNNFASPVMSGTGNSNPNTITSQMQSISLQPSSQSANQQQQFNWFDSAFNSGPADIFGTTSAPPIQSKQPTQAPVPATNNNFGFSFGSDPFAPSATTNTAAFSPINNSTTSSTNIFASADDDDAGFFSFFNSAPSNSSTGKKDGSASSPSKGKPAEDSDEDGDGAGDDDDDSDSEDEKTKAKTKTKSTSTSTTTTINATGKQSMEGTVLSPYQAPHPAAGGWTGKVPSHMTFDKDIFCGDILIRMSSKMLFRKWKPVFVVVDTTRISVHGSRREWESRVPPKVTFPIHAAMWVAKPSLKRTQSVKDDGRDVYFSTIKENIGYIPAAANGLPQKFSPSLQSRVVVKFGSYVPDDIGAISYAIYCRFLFPFIFLLC